MSMNEVTKAPLHYVVFDLELEREIKELEGGWADARSGKGGMSCAVAYYSESNSFELYGAGKQEAKRLARDLEDASVIVSYNGMGFDVPVIEGITGERLEFDTHVDLLSMIKAQTGRLNGHGLDNVAQYTLGYGKSGSGALAPVMYKEARVKLSSEGDDNFRDGVNKLIELVNYCLNDVCLTRDLLIFLKEHGYLIGPNGPINLIKEKWWEQLK